MEVVKAKAWKEFITKNHVIPISEDRSGLEYKESVPLCVSLKNVDGIKVPVGSESTKLDYQLRCTLFDISYKQFFGRQWKGPVQSARNSNGKIKMMCNQNIYFYTTVAAEAIVLVFELIGIENLENGKSKSSALGWTFLRVFNEADQLTDLHSNNEPKPYTLDVYYGTPRALFALEEPIESQPNLMKINGCTVNLGLSTNTPLGKLQHLLPVNVIVGPNDIIPGVVDALNSNTNIKDCFRKPRLLKPMSAHVDQVSVAFYPNVDKFEDELLELLNEDRLNRANSVADGQTVAIAERRLRVGVHNGFCYVEDPEVAHLVPQDLSLRRGSSLRKSGRLSTGSHTSLPPGSPRSSLGQNLVLRNTVPLNGMAYDPMFTVVFTLEYLITEPTLNTTQKGSTRLKKNQSYPVVLRWTAWSPFNKTPDSGAEITVSFVGGGVKGPDGVFSYKTPSSSMDTESARKNMCGSITFKFIDQAKQAAMVEQADGRNTLGLPGTGYAPTGSAVYNSDTSRSELLSQSGRAAGGRTGGGKPPIPSPVTPSREPPIRSHARSERKPEVPQRTPDRDMVEPQSHHSPFSTGQQQYGGVPILMSQNSQQMMMSYPPQPVVGYPPQGYPNSAVAPMSYPMEIRHISEGGLAGGIFTGGAGDLQELPFTPVHAPIMAIPPGGRSAGQGLTRAAYARLYSANFPPILDRHKQDAEVVNPDDYINFVMAREESDTLQCNEIVMQFLAFSRLTSLQADGGIESHDTVFFTFQFYKFPHITSERLLLGQPEQELTTSKASQPRILRRLAPNGTVKQGPAGYQIKYFVDPTHMKAGEGALFVKHLSQQTLHVDVWDGDSLLLIGSCAVELKHLCRQGREAVQVTYELDIVSTEVNEEHGGLTGDLSRGGSIRPVGVQNLLKGKLHFRLANVGRPVDAKFMSKNRSTLPLTGSAIIKPDKANVQGSFIGGSLTTINNSQELHRRVTKANHMTSLNSELASILHTKREPNVEENNRVNNKLSRMQAVRAAQQKGNEENTVMHSISSFKQQKAERARDLKVIEAYRSQNKEDGIRRLLNQAITTEYTIHPSMGSTEFFEFQLTNPNNTETTVSIRTDSDDISVVTDEREWRHFKMLCKLDTPLEEGMFNLEANKRDPEVFLRPKETVYIPMKYLTYEANHGTSPETPSSDEINVGLRSSNASSLAKSLTTRVHRVYFNAVPDNKLVSILALKVEPEPHVIDQTFRFHQPEQSFLKKSIRLPPFHNAVNHDLQHPGYQQLYVQCSDENVVCESYKRNSNEPQDVFIKTAVGPSPQQKKFFVCIYTDRYLSKPDQIWQFYVHALQRVDVSCVEGQTTRLTLILRGTQSTRLVRCCSSHKSQMQISPNQDFMLTASAVHEIHVGVRPLHRGTKFFYINVVDVEAHQLIRNWLVCVTCNPPVISKTFELQLPAGGGKGSNKRISFTNPYSQKKIFVLTNNRNDLLQFKETRLEMGSKETKIISLRFMPALNVGSAEILIFINDDEDKNEETFCVKVTYITEDED